MALSRATEFFLISVWRQKFISRKNVTQKYSSGLDISVWTLLELRFVGAFSHKGSLAFVYAASVDI
jgi:hypothetical protein